MKEFTHDTFKKILRVIDEENTYDFETFIEGLNDAFEVLTDSEIEEVMEFLVEELGVENDNGVSNMSTGEINQLIKFVDQIVSDGGEEDNY